MQAEPIKPLSLLIINVADPFVLNEKLSDSICSLDTKSAESLETGVVAHPLNTNKKTTQKPYFIQENSFNKR
ncbi:hypothetical protein VCRA2123O159_280038 [Vibrio crassostreae]|nr:hypothetical protein VCRA2113O138_280031 [Vibrio crassostreae]CAK2251465.1 hypothetical protein VCRA2113O140_90171 [Vibrio crassostreae]CAK2376414.1 hypothetical protein VCRA2116O141_90149 [Vibrio crassostreae]CAK2838113.1 hypothetical protein VCRA2119O148_280038 [Vibrio crassostreae]CAK2917394.1 hypothetical protein VCRA2127O160_280031 [Vibrio crassostreae]